MQKLSERTTYPGLEFCAINFVEKQYVEQLELVKDRGILSKDRTGVGTKRIQHAYFKIEAFEFPLLYFKKIFAQNAVTEAIWILSGRTDIAFLEAYGCNYWRKWANAAGELGPIYGKQLRDFNGTDQLDSTIWNIIRYPDSRQIYINLWNPAELMHMSLPPCWPSLHFTVTEGKLHLHVTQRSGDAFVGVPYDFVLFKTMQVLISIFTGLDVGDLHLTVNDFHVYLNHEEQVNTYLTRWHSFYTEYAEYSLPTITLDSIFSDWCERELKWCTSFDGMLEKIIANDCKVFNFSEYNPMPYIKAEVAK